MLALLATGLPAWPSAGHAPAGAFDWSPFLLVVAALAVAPLLFGIRLTVRSTGTLVVGGIVLGLLGNGIGSIPAVCIGVISLTLASPWVHRSRRHGARTIVELPD